MGLQQRPGDSGHHSPTDEHERLRPGAARHDRGQRVQREAQQGAVREMASSQRIHADAAILIRPLGP